MELTADGISMAAEDEMFRKLVAALLLSACLLLPAASWSAVGDAVVNNSSVATTAFLDIQPGASIEWFVHNVYHEADIEISWYDGTNTITVEKYLGAGKRAINARVTNSIRIRVKNLDAGTKRIGYDAVVTK